MGILKMGYHIIFLSGSKSAFRLSVNKIVQHYVGQISSEPEQEQESDFPV